MSKHIDTNVSQCNASIKILIEISGLKKEIKELTKSIEKLCKICGKMDNHIDNVESVYHSVKIPLSYVKNKINILMGNDEDELPEITHI